MKTIKWMGLLIILLVAVPIVQNGIRYKMGPLVALLVVHSWQDTQWSPTYSYWRFRQIVPGMTTNDVIRILGPCLAETTYEGTRQWHYTCGRDGAVMSSSSFSTHERWVCIDSNGTVTGKVMDFNFD